MAPLCYQLAQDSFKLIDVSFINYLADRDPSPILSCNLRFQVLQDEANK